MYLLTCSVLLYVINVIQIDNNDMATLLSHVGVGQSKMSVACLEDSYQPGVHESQSLPVYENNQLCGDQRKVIKLDKYFLRFMIFQTFESKNMKNLFITMQFQLFIPDSSTVNTYQS